MFCRQGGAFFAHFLSRFIGIKKRGKGKTIVETSFHERGNIR
ncbi:hypothetical protein P799_12110 [Lysinibacillus sphaericus CBAM5]|uniref:Uncharacterized protein n=1 Tax=Lysinibacillus sphaericus CBAM5 TaxID=1400869 RepID=W7SAJ2_LYSSH|nr:hypothetical protein P799_12110 [Lysinibacillus sphaericus CBAM5]